MARAEREDENKMQICLLANGGEVPVFGERFRRAAHQILLYVEIYVKIPYTQ